MIGGQRYLVDVADPEEGGDVGLVRLGREGVAEEDDGPDLAESDAAADDQVSPIRAVGDAFDLQSRFLRDQPARAAGGYERVALQDGAVASGKLGTIL